MPPSRKEGRRFDRVATRVAVTLHCGTRQRKGVLRQLSRGGAMVETDEIVDLHQGRRVVMSVSLPGDGNTRKLEATVIYRLQGFEIEPGGRIDGVGLRFSGVGDSEGEVLDRFISAQRHCGHLIYDSEAKRAVDVEWQLSRFLRRVVDSAGVWLVVLDEHGNVVLWNEYAERISGYSSTEVVGKRTIWGSLFPVADDRDRINARAGYVVATGEPVEAVETTVVCKDGTERIVSWDLSSLVEEGDRIGLIGIGRDLTEQRSVEQQLWQAQKLEAVGRLAGGIAHDFNNVLTAIMGFCEIYNRKIGDSDSLRQGFREILRCAERGCELTRQLLAFSRKQVLEPVPVNLNDLIDETKGMLGRLIGEHIDLAVMLQEDLGAVRVDPVQVQQVLINLAVNARDAMPQGGTLAVETRNVVMDEDDPGISTAVSPGSYVGLIVADNGHGMDEHTLSRIYEPFFSTKDKRHGTGLGLSTVYGIVKQSGGFIQVDSMAGMGTTFRVHFPRADAAYSGAPEADEPEDHRLDGAETILLVEDDEQIRTVLGNELRARGYTVLEATGNDEAERILARQGLRIDLVLTDIVLPGPSGPEIASNALRQHPEARVLFMSGYSRRAVVERGMLEPHQRYIQKPFRPSEVSLEVRRILDGGDADA